MSGLFDGMAGLLAGVFGEAVTYIPKRGQMMVVQSVFREAPIEVAADDGRAVLIEAATWRVRKEDVPYATEGDIIVLRDQRRYRILNSMPSGSPAGDAFRIFELELML